MKKIKLERHTKIKLIISISLIGLLVLSFFFASSIENALGLNVRLRKNQVDSKDIGSAEYCVSYLDVGQGNSIFIKLPDGKTALIDGGDVAYGETIAEYLISQGVESIDYLIATHSDSDHIGGLNYIIDNFEIKNIFRPFQIAGSGTSAETFIVYEYEELGEIYNQLMQDTNNRSKMSRVTSSVYKEFIKNIYSETYTDGDEVYSSLVTVFYDGLTIEGDDYKFEFFAPLKRESNYNLIDYTNNTFGYAAVGYGASETNENSAIFLFNCYEDYYLFTGDASFNSAEKGTNKAEDDFVESLTEEEMLLIDKVSVLLLGHHGSKYSSGEELLNLVTPKFIIISSGHEYGHPADETLERCSKLSGLEPDYLLRTDEFGNIHISNVGGKISYSLEKEANKKVLMISYYELGSIVVLLVIFIMFSIKPIHKKQ